MGKTEYKRLVVRLIGWAAVYLPLAAAAQKATTGFVPVGQLRVHYAVAGQGPPVLLLHAGFQDDKMWAPQVRVLTARHRVVTLDLPGHGLTQGRDTTQLMQAVVAQVLDHLQMPRVALVGLSMGAACAYDFALAHPTRVSKLVLVSGGMSGLESRLDTATKQYYPALTKQLAQGDTAMAAEVFTRYWCDGPFRRPNEVKPRVRRYIRQTTLATMRRHKVSGWPRLAPQSTADKVPQLGMPVLVVVGDKDLPYIVRVGEYLRDTLKTSEYVLVPGAGHMLNLETPRTFNRALVRFIDR